MSELALLTRVARALGIEPVIFEIRHIEDIARAFDAPKGQTRAIADDALWAELHGCVSARGRAD